MAQHKALIACSECGYSAAKWFGKCPDCGSWSSARAIDEAGTGSLEFVSLADRSTSADRFSCGIDEVDRVLGGGLVPGEVVLLAGEPGIGKSTLVLQLLDALVRAGRSTLLVSGEESIGQIALRGTRLGVDAARLRVSGSTSVAAIGGAIESERPDLLVVDSVQTIRDEMLDQAAGSPTQVRECSSVLVRLAKATGTAVILVGHVTKDGSVAGPKTLEHIVDVVLDLDGERGGTVRCLRAMKNRFGSCDEAGVFTMTERGLSPVPDPSAHFLADRRAGVSGSVVYCGLEGTRPMLMEIQALIGQDESVPSRRVALGIDPKRLPVFIEVLRSRAGVKIEKRDVFLAAVGGLKAREPASDLAACLALASAKDNVPVDAGLVALGEVGLVGEVRRVPGIERRLKEAARLGFGRALVPLGTEAVSRSLEVVPVSNLSEALAAADSRFVIELPKAWT